MSLNEYIFTCETLVYNKLYNILRKVSVGYFRRKYKVIPLEKLTEI